MDRLKAWWGAHGLSRRRLIQLYAAVLYNAHVRGFLEGKIYTGPAKSLCVPGLNCYSCPGAVAACPLGALQNAIAASANRPAFYVAGVLLIFGLTLGRAVCGYLCPMGLIQELIHKLPTRKVKKGLVTRALSWGKYAVLGIFVFLIPAYHALKQTPLPAFCKYICPAGTLEGALPLLLHPANGELTSALGLLFSWKALLALAIFAACVFIYRAFCRFLCPLGAIYSLFARIALLGVKVDAGACTHCGACVEICPVDIRRVGDRECVQCGKCIAACPEKAISFKAGKLTLRGNETGGRAAP